MLSIRFLLLLGNLGVALYILLVCKDGHIASAFMMIGLLFGVIIDEDPKKVNVIECCCGAAAILATLVFIKEDLPIGWMIGITPSLLFISQIRMAYIARKS